MKQEGDLQVIIKAKKLCVHTIRVTSNCKKFPKNTALRFVTRCKTRQWKYMKICLKRTERF